MGSAKWCAFAVATLLTVTAWPAPDASEGSSAPVGDVVEFGGAITAASVEAFIAAHRDARIERVVLDSMGGDVASALTLANWMVDRRVDVEVRNLCASSCANYLFAAGRRKIIDERAVVVWHGSMLQKDFRAMCAPQVPRAEPTFGPPGYVEGLDAAMREARTGMCGAYRTLVADQDAFFARVHVDEYLTRLGQEPTNFDVLWTVPVPVMERMGLTGVEARPDYASRADIARFNEAGVIAEPLAALGFDDAGDVVRLTP